MSSRIIVKNLPKVINGEQLKEHFSKFGQVTDVRLVHTPTGVFRRFAFIGYHNDAEADKAAQYFNKTFIDTCKVEVELAKPYGDKEIPRSWSRYTKAKTEKESNSVEAEANDTEDLEKECIQRLNQDVHKSKLAMYLGELYELEANPEFAEFLSLHKSKVSSKAWTNDDITGETITPAKAKSKKRSKLLKEKVKPSIVSVESRRPGGKGLLMTRTHLKFEEDEAERKTMDQQSTEETVTNNSSCSLSGAAVVESLSDMDYLKSKIVRKRKAEDSLTDEYIADKKVRFSEDESPKIKERSDKVKAGAGGPYTLKMRGVPFNSKPKDVRAFFYPLKLLDVRMINDKNNKPTGIVYVDFVSENDLMDGLRRNRDCMGRRYIELFKDDPSSNQAQVVSKPRPWESKSLSEDEVETVGESGRLFIRNLSYSITEDDLSQLFEKYGPLSEVLLPLDRTTKRPIGLGFVTFMLPENAVKAYSELDGQIFQGRLLHILPSKPPVTPSTKKVEEAPSKHTSSYKKSKESALKEKSSSAHNWNSLFLGSNAVVDSMADRYDVEKSDLLDPSTDQSLAVRLALGETQVVAETREFLEDQGVVLDVFQQDKPKRSKKIILVKNLAFGTTSEELKDLFEPFGLPARIIIPPGGISALVEYSEASTARKAFKGLTYNEFKHVPLYLEWAPLGVIKSDANNNPDRCTMVEPAQSTKEPEDGVTGSTVFVKNLSFKTNDESLGTLFSKIGKIKKAVIARKANMKNPGNPLSMGYGFVEYERTEDAMKSIKQLQNCELDGHKIELKVSCLESRSKEQEKRKKVQHLEQKSSKIMVRNIPFEAGKKEIMQLFGTFGKLTTVRLPKKIGSSNEHRGFCFVEFITKEDAKRAFESLCHSTHLYGRRLVLEWAELDDTVSDIRQKTARYFNTSNSETNITKRREKLAKKLLSTLETVTDDVSI